VAVNSGSRARLPFSNPWVAVNYSDSCALLPFSNPKVAVNSVSFAHLPLLGAHIRELSDGRRVGGIKNVTIHRRFNSLLLLLASFHVMALLSTGCDVIAVLAP